MTLGGEFCHKYSRFKLLSRALLLLLLHFFHFMTRYYLQ